MTVKKVLRRNVQHIKFVVFILCRKAPLCFALKHRARAARYSLLAAGAAVPVHIWTWRKGLALGL
jgi:hypothetical protein